MYTCLTRDKEEFLHFEKIHNDSDVQKSNRPIVLKQNSTAWTGHIEKYNSKSSFKDVELFDTFGLENHQEFTKAGLKKYTCDELETQVLNSGQEYVQKRAEAVAVREWMKPWGYLGCRLEPVCNHLTYLLLVSSILVAFRVSDRAPNAG